MRILVSDYSGHPFQVQLSRELASRGHDVLHIFFGGFQTPKGNLTRQPDDPPGFAIKGLTISAAFKKASFVARRRQEIEVGQRMADIVAEFRPEIVLSSNAPLDTQRVFQAAVRRAGAGFVYWLQDIYSAAIANIVPRKLPVIGHGVAAYYRWLEFRMLRRSDHVVAITRDFVDVLAGQGIARERITVIENWAPLTELAPAPRDNPWARAHMTDAPLRIVYSGTLGYKHNPALLLAIARRLPQVSVLVFSEGVVADELARDAAAAGLANLSVQPWVSFADLPNMLSGADIFIAMIEKEAGFYSVPSKILTYLAVGRPIVASVPTQNLAARLLEREGAGLVAAPDDLDATLAAVERLAVDLALRQTMADNGRAYAGRTFVIDAIGDAFERVVVGVPSRQSKGNGK